MISDDLFGAFAGEKLDKQIIGKIPYFLLLALLIYASNLIVLKFFVITHVGFDLQLLILVICAGVFFYFTYSYNKKINEGANKIFDYVDFGKITSKIEQIYEGTGNLYDDIGGKVKPEIEHDYLLAGIFLSLSSVLCLLIAFQTVNLSLEYAILVLFVGAIYAYTDISAADFFKGIDTTSLPVDIELMQAYMMGNTLNSVSKKRKNTKNILFVLAKYLTPLTYPSIPNFDMKPIWVYHSKDLTDWINLMINEGENIEKDKESKKTNGKYARNNAIPYILYVKEGHSHSDVLIGDPKVTTEPRLDNFNHQPLREKFPWLFSVKDKDKKKSLWCSFEIKRNDDGEEHLGFMIIHAYRKLSPLEIDKKQHITYPRDQDDPAVVFLIFIMGEPLCVRSFSYKINVISRRFN